VAAADPNIFLDRNRRFTVGLLPGIKDRLPPGGDPGNAGEMSVLGSRPAP